MKWNVTNQQICALSQSRCQHGTSSGLQNDNLSAGQHYECRIRHISRSIIPKREQFTRWCNDKQIKHHVVIASITRCPPADATMTLISRPLWSITDHTTSSSQENAAGGHLQEDILTLAASLSGLSSLNLCILKKKPSRKSDNSSWLELFL